MELVEHSHDVCFENPPASLKESHRKTVRPKGLLGKNNYSEWFQEKFNGFDDFLGTSLNGLEKPTTKFLLAVEAKLQ